MSRLPAVKAKDVTKALKKSGFRFSFQAGSHATYKNPLTKSRVTVPMHKRKDLKRGTLRAIIRQAGLTVDEFIELTK